MSKLSKPAINFIVDALALVAFVADVATAFMLVAVFSPARRTAGWTLWGMSFDGWFRVHIGAVVGFAVVALVHVILHWPWVCSFVATRWARFRSKPVAMPPDGIRTIYGVMLLVGVILTLAVFIGAAEFSIRAPK